MADEQTEQVATKRKEKIIHDLDNCPECGTFRNLCHECNVCRCREESILFQICNDQHVNMVVAGKPVGIIYKVSQPTMGSASWQVHFSDCPKNAPDGTMGMNWDTRSFSLHNAMRSATERWYRPTSIPRDNGEVHCAAGGDE